MIPGFSFEYIELIQVAYIEVVCLVVQMHSIVHSGILEPHIIHERHSFVRLNGIAGNIRLLHDHNKFFREISLYTR